MLDIKYPIVQAGMIWCSGWRLASAVSESGGLGLIGSGSMRPDLLREHVRKARAATEKPVGVNIPLIYKYAEEMASACLNEGIRIFFTSAGSPKKLTPMLKRAGAKVVHVVSTPELASKCEEAGTDAVVAEGFEAGGHNGRDELTTMVLVPMVADAVKIPVLAAGGIADGRQMAAAMALGAEGVQVGSRFAATLEASCHPSFKRAILESPSNGTFLSIKKHIPVRLLKNRFYERVAEAEARGATREELEALLGSGRAKLGMFDGDIDEGELEIGQVAGMITDIPPASDVLRDMARECIATMQKLA